jgi:hypothetical protein
MQNWVEITRPVHHAGPASHASGCETSRSRPNCCDRNLATNCPLTLLPARSSGSANVPSTPSQRLGLPRQLHALERLLQARLLLVRQ